jgi:hypothetical protein
VPRGWRQVALWIPLGYATTRFAGHDRSLPILVASIVLLAVIHRFVPGVVELVAGGGGLLVVLSETIDGRGAGATLGDAAVVVVVVFGSLMWVSGFVRLLGSGNPREMARHLIVAVAVLHVGLVALRPMGQTTLGAQEGMSQPVILLIVLLATTLVALRAQAGFPMLGVGLVAAQCLLILTGVSAAVSPVTALAATAAFVGVVLALAGRDDDVRSLEMTPTVPTVRAA